MNDEKILIEMEGEQEQSAQVSNRKLWSGVIAMLLCLCLAVLVWICTMNTEDTDYIPVQVTAENGYTCQLSVDGVTVKGKVAALRKLDTINVTIPAYVGEGTYYLPVELLELPAGVTLAEDWEAVLTVTAK